MDLNTIVLLYQRPHTGHMVKASEFCEKLGGKVFHLPHTEAMYERLGKHEDYAECPFMENVGIVWKRKWFIYHTGDRRIDMRSVRTQPNWGTILHEFGHLFVDRYYEHRYSDMNKWQKIQSEEFRFLGWEYACARLLNVQLGWMNGNGSYLVNLGKRSQGGLAQLKRRDPEAYKFLLEVRIQFALKHKLIKFENGKYHPLVLR